MEIIKKIAINQSVDFYILHTADEVDVGFYMQAYFNIGDVVWKFYDFGFMDDYNSEPDLEFDSSRNINGADFYLRFEPQDLVQQ